MEIPYCRNSKGFRSVHFFSAKDSKGLAWPLIKTRQILMCFKSRVYKNLGQIHRNLPRQGCHCAWITMCKDQPAEHDKNGSSILLLL